MKEQILVKLPGKQLSHLKWALLDFEYLKSLPLPVLIPGKTEQPDRLQQQHSNLKLAPQQPVLKERFHL